MIIDFGTPGTAFPTEPIIKPEQFSHSEKQQKTIGNTVGANCVRPPEKAR
ncbi:MAG: hypothetical protein ACI4IX_09455 [Acutalibacteraceae bacterium]